MAEEAQNTPQQDVIAEEYMSSLADLTVNSKPLINMLTMLAEENVESAPTIVKVIEKHLSQVLNLSFKFFLPINFDLRGDKGLFVFVDTSTSLLKSFCSGGEYMVQLLWVKIESRVKKIIMFDF
jgi:hypothetical protein